MSPRSDRNPPPASAGGRLGHPGHLGQGADDDLLGHQAAGQGPGLLPGAGPHRAAAAAPPAALPRRRQSRATSASANPAPPRTGMASSSQTTMLATRMTVPAFLTNSSVRRPTSIPTRRSRGRRSGGGSEVEPGPGRGGQQSARQDRPHRHGHGDAPDVEGEDHRPLLAGEEHRRHQHVDRQAGPAGHEGHQQAGQDPVAPRLQRPGGQHGRDGAAEPHHHGQEGGAGKAHDAHDPGGEHPGPQHVAGVLQHAPGPSRGSAAPGTKARTPPTPARIPSTTRLSTQPPSRPTRPEQGREPTATAGR